MRVFKATNEELKEIEDVVYDEFYFREKARKCAEESIANLRKDLGLEEEDIMKEREYLHEINEGHTKPKEDEFLKQLHYEDIITGIIDIILIIVLIILLILSINLFFKIIMGQIIP